MAASDIDGEWRPSASLSLLRYRAEIYQRIRHFFDQRDVLEVETPALSIATVTDPNIDSFTTHFKANGDSGDQLYLQTSPEYAMKRLLAAGSGAIYQICKVFRQGESGGLHNPEFTMLEWYRPGFNDQQLMAELDDLVTFLGSKRLLPEETEYITYAQAFRQYLSIDAISASTSNLVQCAKNNNINVVGLGYQDRDAWLDLLLSHCIQPYLGKNKLTFLTHFPVSQGALSRVCESDKRLAHRFELFINGIELANGYNELCDAKKLSSRFEQDQRKREQQNKVTIPIDLRLLEAVQFGLPQCAGVAVGLDRLIMILAKEKNLQNILAFPISRA